MFQGQTMNHLALQDLNRLRNNKISLMLQEPLVAFNPLQTIEQQLTEAVMVHHDLSLDLAKSRVYKSLAEVHLIHKLSIMPKVTHEIAVGRATRTTATLINESELLIADEPTTALDASCSWIF